MAATAEPSKPLLVDGEVVVARGYQVVWFLFKGMPFDVGRFYRPDGTWTGYYVDILEPVSWFDSDPQTLAPIIDLFLDLWIPPNGTPLVLDEEEFDAACSHGALTTAQALHARTTLDHLVRDTHSGGFPPQITREFMRDSESGNVEGPWSRRQ